MTAAETSPVTSRAPRRIATLDFWQTVALWCLVASGWFVVVEPAPYELLFALAFVLFLPVGMRIPKATLPLVFFLALYNIGGAFSLIGAPDDPISRQFIIVSFYMAATGIFFSFIVATDPLKRMETIRNAYIFAAVVGAITGIMGYFNILGMGASWSPDGRAQGAFKDPNVFSTFLIPAFIFIAQDLLTGKARRPMIWLASLLVIAFGIFIAFSRGAWFNTILASVLLVMLTFILSSSGALRNRIMISALAGFIALAALLAVALSFPEISRLFQERAQLIQYYDAGETGRFGNQINSIPLILTQINGMNPRHFRYIFGEDPHNVYINAFASYGWLGGVSFITLIIMTVWAGWRAITIRTPWQYHAIAVYCPFISTMLQAIQIDIDHWRHFYLLLGLTWGLMAASLAYVAPPRREASAVI